jgi:putative ATP-dependent endonuclease of OLD family
VHRASSTLSLFGIPHVVLWDADAAMPTSDMDLLKRRLCQDKAALDVLSLAAHDPRSSLMGTVRLTGTIEHWLGITEEKDGPWKAANIGSALAQGFADPGSPLPGKVAKLLYLLRDLFDEADLAPHLAEPGLQGALIARSPGPSLLHLPREFATFPRQNCHCTRPAP